MGRQRIDMQPAARDAALVLGQQIQLARRERNWTAEELATRAGITVNTLSRIEAGMPTSSIGNVFNAAVTAGVPLFGIDDPATLARIRRTGEERLALVPSRVRHRKVDNADYDF
jgi:transcriptional regulator with XRE-family HTH domain